jgi:TusA-related sulfurtransferase
MEKKYCVSYNGEEFHGEDYDSREEAIEMMTLEMNDGEELYVGISDPITVDDVKNCCYVDGEDFECRMYDEVGEVAEGWLSGVSNDEWDELNKIIADWIWEKAQPSFYRVKDVEKVIIKKI